MKAFGYAIGGEELLHLEELSMVLALDEIRDLVDFLKSVTDQMEEHGTNFGHNHLRDWLNERGRDSPAVDVVISGK